MGAVEVVRSRSLFRFYGPRLLGKVKEFEERFAEYCGVKYSLSVSSGTAALHTGLGACGLGPGDEVIVPAITFFASATSVLMQKAIPVFADVEPDTLNLDLDDVEGKITERTRAIMPVHLYGQPVEMDRLMNLAEERNIHVIEDCAHAHGSIYKGRKAGSIGHVGCFSLQLNKVITCGDGGVVTTSREDLYDNALLYHDGGWGHKPLGPVTLGYNYRLTEVQGAIALEQLKKIEAILARLRYNASYVMKALSHLNDYITFRRTPEYMNPTYYALIFFIDKKALGISIEQFLKALKAEGIPVGKPNRPVYKEPLFINPSTLSKFKCPFECPVYGGKVDYGRATCPKAEEAMERAVYLPNSSSYGDEELNDITEAVEKIITYYKGRVESH